MHKRQKAGSGSQIPRRSERFMTSAVSSPMGRVVDVSRDGFRLCVEKKLPFKKGETHEIVLRAGGQQLRAMARIQWTRRVGLWPPRYELGLQIVDQRPGVGEAILQLGQFGCVGSSQVSAAPPEQTKPAAEPEQHAEPQTPPPADEPSVELVDLYGLLGVNEDAEPDEIRDAFRQLALEHHPDRSNRPDAADVFAQITSAYSVLRDPQRRKWYDEMRRSGSAA